MYFPSEPEKRSKFQTYIPTSKNRSDISENENNNQQNLYGNESILLIDDEPLIVDVQTAILERHGYKVRSFLNSLDALSEFHAYPDYFDIVLCDMAMPVMTGIALADKMKQIRPDIKIIICTGFSQQINKDTYHILGVDGFLLKPFKTEESLKLIRQILDKKQGLAKGSV